MMLASGGTDWLALTNNVALGSGGNLFWTSNASPIVGTADLVLKRAAAGVLALNNGVNLQTLRVYDAAGTGFNAVSGNQFLAKDGTAGVPSLAFASSPGTGWFSPNTAQIQSTYAGSAVGSAQFYGNGLSLGNAVNFGWSSGSNPAQAAIDTALFRDAADTLAQRRSTNPQTFRVYNTFTDASNYERGFSRWASNIFEVGTEALGTGANRAVRVNSAGNINLSVNGTDYWRVLGANANLVAVTDNTIDIGAAGATRPRTGYFGTSIVVPTVNATTAYQLNGVMAVSQTAPTATTFCTSPSIQNANGTAAFTVNVGTGCATSVGTITMPAALTGWVATCHDVTTPAGNYVEQTGGTTTTITLQNYSRTLGTALNWTASDVLRCTAVAY
jgi:hypothetical protein